MLALSSRCVVRRPSPSSILVLTAHARFLSTPTPTPRPSSSSSPPPNAHRTKPKLDLRPAPIKPHTVSATHVPTKPTVPLPHPSATAAPPSLKSVKEVAKRDIEDAEAHGILAPPPPGANWFKRTLHKALELLTKPIQKFYYRGVKLIFVRRKEINLILARVKAGGAPLTRFENRLIRTQKSDINKVVPFLFIALILEEVIPLIAIYAPFMLPSTCILPSQRDRIDEKRTEKAIAYAAEYRHIYTQLKHAESPKGHIPLDALKTTGSSTAVCAVLRLPTAGFDALRIRRIRNHLQFLARDDQLILQDSLLERLSPRGLEEALQERGL
ncbi:hypothetical protein DXG03_003898 [Asterophora parasitica]|uniref:Letm1 RBD domain-containing protein n=1 Tax=Asterophora parasitica TaxID=117018 RepID=A0A9P7KBZ6_9AGAR|nr:hypothetical protein DXG03_003898 [Asterophora parasitica]